MESPPQITTEQLESLLLDAVRRGASMEEIADLRDPNITSPEAAIAALKRGNERFFSGQAQRPEKSANERRAQIAVQTPFAVVLGCSDSRVPIEIVFDQGLGDLFIVRVAGNIADPATLGSIEYAVTHLKCQLVMVLGHEGCGAVQAAMLSAAELEAEPPHVRYLIGRIQPAVTGLPRIRDKKALMREAVINHVRHQVAVLRQNTVIAAGEASSELAVIGGFYEISSGAVDFLETEEELALESSG